MAQESKAAVIGAIAANFSIAIAKFAFGIAGKSSAMLSEGVHSGIDGINDLLLLYGLKASKRPADEQHPFGYGKELYFWSLIVALSVLSVGGGITAFEGIYRILHPEPIKNPQWSYVALACGAAFDAASLIYGLYQFRVQNRGKRFWEAVRESKDPTTFMVIAEDTAAVLGELIAAVGIFLADRGMLLADGIASVLIACLLAAVAVFLVRETRDLVVGEAVEPEISASLRKIITARDRFSSIDKLSTLHFGPEKVLITMSVRFDSSRSAGELMELVDRVQSEVREGYPAVRYIYINPEPEDRSHT